MRKTADKVLGSLKIAVDAFFKVLNLWTGKPKIEKPESGEDRPGR